jgi:predicted  nucleic acid-binding Zn-ribbon protein
MMSEETRALIVAGITGPFAIAADRLLTWARNRRLDNAAVGLTVDQRWQAWADELKGEVDDLRDRVGKLEEELDHERNRAKGLEAEVDRYRSIARSLLRHVLRLREALGKTDVDVPAIPQDIEDALTGIDLP